MKRFFDWIKWHLLIGWHIEKVSNGDKIGQLIIDYVHKKTGERRSEVLDL